MSKANAIPRSAWTPRDVLLIIAACVLLVGATGALALRDRWASLIGAFSDVPVSISALNTTDYHALVFDPRDPNIVYFGHHNGVMNSIDGGVTWSPVLRQGDVMNLVAIDNTVIAAGHGVFVQSDDGGVNWKFIPTNLPDQDIHGFAVSSSNPHTLFAHIVNYGLWRSDDAGATWTIVSKELPDSVLALTVVPTSPETRGVESVPAAFERGVGRNRFWFGVRGKVGKLFVGARPFTHSAR